MLKPINNRILIKMFPPEAKTPGGLIIPDAAQSKPQKGEVRAIWVEDAAFQSIYAAGEGHLTTEGVHVPLAVELGDIVLFVKHSGSEVPLGDGYLILKEEDILGIIENEQ